MSKKTAIKEQPPLAQVRLLECVDAEPELPSEPAVACTDWLAYENR